MTRKTKAPMLLQLPAGELLQEFGAGNPVPGSGSAAALNGALACSLIATSAKLTMSRSKDRHRQAESEYILRQVGAHDPILRSLVQEDSETFGKVIEARRARDAARTDASRRKHTATARSALRECTKVAMKVVTECLVVARLGLIMVRIGYHAAKGDPAAGTSNALAGATGAICAILVNLKSTRGAPWAVQMYQLASEAFEETRKIQEDLVRSVAGLCRPEDLLNSPQLRLFF